jgi:hypothetical protein
LILAFWLLGGPIEEMIRFFTGGRIQINVRHDEPDNPKKKEEGGES